MRIVHLTDRLTDRGGAHRHLLSVARALAERGHEVHVVAGADDGRGAGLPATVHTVEGLDARTDRPVALEPLLRHLRPDVLHVHTVMNPEALHAAAAWGAVFTVQDHRAFCPSRGKWTAEGEVCRTAFSRAVCASCFTDEGYFDEMFGLTRARLAALGRGTVVVLSEYMRGELIAAGLVADRVHVVPPFVDFGRTGTGTRTHTGTGMSTDPPCVVFVGRLVEAKGPLEAVEAWKRSGITLPLVVAGTGPLRERVQAAGAEVLGWIPHGRIPALLRRARALLLPSRWPEPFGIAGLEALHLGVPVVAWDSGGIREWHPGPLVPRGDVDGMAARLRDAVTERTAMPAGFEREALMDRLQALYATAAGLSSSSARSPSPSPCP